MSLLQSWLYDEINKQQAVQLLKHNHDGDGSFLIRTNLIRENEYVLYVYFSGKIQYYLIKSIYEYLYINKRRKFYDLEDLIEYYRWNPGLITYLRNPVEKNNLRVSLAQIKKNLFKIDRNDIHLIERIGSGYFGDVYRGEHRVTKKQVAVKKLKNGFSHKIVDDEAEFMIKLQNLQTLQHKNIVKFIGTCRDHFDGSILIVTEFVKNGSLSNYLSKHKQEMTASFGTFSRLLKMCIDICNGMKYLEAHHVIHRDLACRNCLVNANETVKVCDFGMARFTSYDFYQADPSTQLPVKWSAPEVIKHKSFTNKSDVWSFGCCMYEIFSFGKVPYGRVTANHFAAQQITSGILPERPTWAPSSFYDDVFLRIWRRDPSQRPSFKELRPILKKYRF